MAQHHEEDVTTRVAVITKYGLPVAIATFLVTGLDMLLKLPIAPYNWLIICSQSAFSDT